MGAVSALLGTISKVFGNINVFLDFEVVGPGNAHVAKIDFVTDVDVKCVIIGTAGQPWEEVQIIVMNLVERERAAMR